MSTAAVNKNSGLVAKRWARALMELAQENEGISKEDILDDLCEVSENINSSQELCDILNNPSVSADEKKLILSKLFENKLLPIVYRFIVELNQKGRLVFIDSIASEFRSELEQLKNIVRIGVVSAIELDEDKKVYIRNSIASKLGKDVLPEWKVDSEIIGGLIFEIGEIIVDNSVRHKLEDLSKHIIKG